MDQTHAQSLIRTQIRLEYSLDAEGLLVPFPGSTEQARFIVHRHATGTVRFYRHDLPPDSRRRLAALPGAAAFDCRDAVREILAAQSACTQTFFGTSGVFVFVPNLADCPEVARVSAGFQVVVGGDRASIAWSVRENASAEELAVETAEGYRRCGYGRQVAAAWGYDVMAQGKVAFYSYAEDNVASRALARSLGVVEFSTVAAYE
jgi:hypothetical protein